MTFASKPSDEPLPNLTVVGHATRCPHCKSTNVEFYDGCLGYEAIRCHECHTESDLNDPQNFGPFECTCQSKK